MSRIDLKKYLYELTTQGFEVSQGRTHMKIVHPSGRKFTCSISPSNGNAHKELFRDIRRYKKQQQQEKPAA